MFMVRKLLNFLSKSRKNINIKVDSSVRIYPNVVLDADYGGSITVGAKSELLHGVILMTYGGNIKIGENCSINPYTVLYGHGNLTIGNNVRIQAQSGVGRNISDGKIIQGSPAFEYNDFSKSYVHFKNLPKLMTEIQELKKQMINNKSVTNG